MGFSQKVRVALKYGVLSFYGLGRFYRLTSGRRSPTILGKEQRFPGIGPLPNLLPFMIRTVMAPVCASFSINESQDPLEVKSFAFLGLMVLTSFCHILKSYVIL